MARPSSGSRVCTTHLLPKPEAHSAQTWAPCKHRVPAHHLGPRNPRDGLREVRGALRETVEESGVGSGDTESVLLGEALHGRGRGPPMVEVGGVHTWRVAASVGCEVREI